MSSLEVSHCTTSVTAWDALFTVVHWVFTNIVGVILVLSLEARHCTTFVTACTSVVTFEVVTLIGITFCVQFFRFAWLCVPILTDLLW